jgi:hypothetical protein
MAKAIICIHGRSNKPAKPVLAAAWRASLDEGLRAGRGFPLPNVPVEMAYYADLYYAAPVPEGQEDEAYRPAAPGAILPYRKSRLEALRGKVGGWLDAPADWLEDNHHVFSSLARDILRVALRDLGDYYNDSARRKAVKDRLLSLLVEYREHEIILIAHSMGSIAAYELLRELGSEEAPHTGLSVEHLLTFGSPLGLTPVQGNIVRRHAKLRTPTCVTKSWTNFSDGRDFVCIDSHLRDDYEANSSGVRVVDVPVCNDFPGNPHKAYGYLRTPELSERLAGLL